MKFYLSLFLTKGIVFSSLVDQYRSEEIIMTLVKMVGQTLFRATVLKDRTVGTGRVDSYSGRISGGW